MLLFEHQVPGLPLLWGLGQMVLLWVCFFLSKVTQEAWSCLSSPPACSHHIQGLCVHVCVCVFICAHTVGYRLSSGDHWCGFPGNSVGVKVTADAYCGLSSWCEADRLLTEWVLWSLRETQRVYHYRRTVTGRSSLRIRGNEIVLVVALLGLGRLSFKGSLSCYCAEETACDSS